MSPRPPSTLVCAVTPFNTSGAVDLSAVEHLVGRFGAAGVGAYVGGSSPGEGNALTLAEMEALFGTALAAMGGRAPVRAMGVEPRTAEQLAEIVRLARSVGLDGVQLYALDAGHANRPGPGELETYYRTLLDAAELPAYLSSHIASGYLVPVDLIARLLDDYPHLHGINCTTPDVGYLSQLVDVAGGRADVHVGGPMHALTAFGLGAQGFLSADGNLAPGLARRIVDAYVQGDLAGLHAAYTRFIGLFRINQWGGSMRWLKTAMDILGLPGTHLRPPFQPLDDGARTRIADALDRLGLDEAEVMGNS